MESRASYGTGRRRPASPPARPSPSTAPFGPDDFPGCEPFHLPAAELERYEDRLEFWDGRTHTAWRVCEPTTLHHEGPTQMLAQVAERFAGLRGSPIKCFGSADLVRWEASGTRRWLMQADQVLYLHPGRSRPSGRYIDVDRDPLPDVVLEVDYSTDVRRRKLSIYEEGGFPEVWVLAPPGVAAGLAPADDLRARQRRGVSLGVGERGDSGLETRGDLRRAGRGALVGADLAGLGKGGAGDGRARGYPAGGRPALAHAHPKRGGERPAGGSCTGAGTKAGGRSVRRWYARPSSPGVSRRARGSTRS